MKNVLIGSVSVMFIGASVMAFADPTTQPGEKMPVPGILDRLSGLLDPNPPASVKRTAPATQPAVIAMVNQIDSAYGKITSAAFDGHIIGHFDVEGQVSNADTAFTSTFNAPNQFRHEATDDILLGSTGTTAYSFLSQRDEYQSADAPKVRATMAEWPGFVSKILANQNPSLLLALSKSASAELYKMSNNVTLQPATVVDGVSYDTLRFEMPDGQAISLLTDPVTHLVRQARFDMRKSLEKSGAMDVKQAEVTVEYTRTALDAGVTDNQFAWSAPVGALLSATTVAMADAGDDAAEQKELIGKAAPDFTLNGLDDKPIKLSDLKGSVVVLDFWATWCGPCVAALPHLDELYKAQSSDGLKVFAVDLKQEKGPVQKFVKQKGWSIPVLLDSDGAVAGLFKVSGIPQTVVIGKDGTIKQVYVGSGHEKDIAEAVKKEMH